MIKTNLNKRDIAKNLSSKTGYPLLFSLKLIDEYLNILSLLIKKKSLNLKNIGVFKVINKKERFGRNPKTKEEFLISSRRSISFTASRNLSKKANRFL